MITDKRKFLQFFRESDLVVNEYEYIFDDYYTLKLSRINSIPSSEVNKRIAKAILQIFKSFALTLRLRRKLHIRGHYIFTLLNTKEHLSLLVRRTIAKMPARECLIFEFGGSLSNAPCAAIDASQLCFSHGRLREYFKAILDAPKLWAFVRKLEGLSGWLLRGMVFLELWSIHIRSRLSYDAYRTLLRGSGVKAVTVEFDHNAKCVPLVLAARDEGIATNTFQHGLINSPGGYDPVIADEIFVWGEFFKETLIQYGVPPEKVLVTGCQSISEPRFSYQDDGYVKIIYATTAYTEEEKLKLAEGIREALEQLDSPKLKLAVKKHPSDRLDYDVDLQAPVDFETMTTVDCLPWCDILLGHNTTIALDAMRMGKLVIFMDWIERPLSETVLRFVDEGCCMAIQSPDELGACLKQYMLGNNGLEQIRSLGENYGQLFYKAIGDVAGANAARAILSTI